ncbi:MAG: HflX-like GTP-binding protein, partial [Myxococcaceae bacterium]
MSKALPTLPLAVLLGVQLPGVSNDEHAADLAELGRLVKTLGFEVTARVSQRRDGMGSPTVVGEGKLKELAEITGGTGVVPSGAQPRKSKARERWEAADGEPEAEPADPAEAPAAPRPTVVVVDHEL